MARDHLHHAGEQDRYETDQNGLLEKPWLSITMGHRLAVMMVYSRDRQYGFLVPRRKRNQIQGEEKYYWVGVVLNGTDDLWIPIATLPDEVTRLRTGRQ